MNLGVIAEVSRICEVNGGADVEGGSEGGPKDDEQRLHQSSEENGGRGN